jgi:hypothetical protein
VASFSRSLSSPALKKASPCISILRKSPERSVRTGGTTARDGGSGQGETRSRGVTDRVCDGSRMGHTAQAAHDKASAGCRQQSNIQASIEFRELTLVHVPAVRVDHFNTPRNSNNLPGLFRVYPNPAVESDSRFQREASAEKGEEKMRGVEKSARPEAQTKSTHEGGGNSLPRHLEAASDHEASLEFSKSLGFARLGVEALEFWLHILVRQRYTGVEERSHLDATCEQTAV